MVTNFQTIMKMVVVLFTGSKKREIKDTKVISICSRHPILDLQITLMQSTVPHPVVIIRREVWIHQLL